MTQRKTACRYCGTMVPTNELGGWDEYHDCKPNLDTPIGGDMGGMYTDQVMEDLKERIKDYSTTAPRTKTLIDAFKSVGDNKLAFSDQYMQQLVKQATEMACTIQEKALVQSLDDKQLRDVITLCQEELMNRAEIKFGTKQ